MFKSTPSDSLTTAVGIDGCKAGWLAVAYQKGTWKHRVLKTIQELPEFIDDDAQVLIDIPIGLASEGFERTVEQPLRKELKHRSSTVFNAPVRAAVYAETKALARDQNIALTGKSLSEQSLNIGNKIKEVDVFLSEKNTDRCIIYESHPELCFKYLNDGQVLATKKSTNAGLQQRLDLLNCYYPEIKSVYERILSTTLRKDLKPDDIVDAFCLCLVAKLGLGGTLQFITDTNRVDQKGIEVAVAYCKP